MNLDPRTLLFSLVLTYGLSVLGIFVAAAGRKSSKPDGMRKWAMAMFLEMLTWGLIAARGRIPDFFSVVVANGPNFPMISNSLPSLSFNLLSIP